MAAGPNALRGSGPNPNLAFEDALTPAGSPDPRNNRVCITSSCPRQFLWLCLPPTATTPANNFGSLNCSPRTIMAPSHASDFVSKRNGRDLDRPRPRAPPVTTATWLRHSIMLPFYRTDQHSYSIARRLAQAGG